ncbi:hypothetical protein GWE18_08010 [Bradyrhizobium sp. CSA112]|uniref:hypothetical protein n=1 Tax=Bradyrhizobium sp. CSA112 TaxID=2699170 RepID=UPI0023AF84F9|nr:hypothetical protein [Bradyrhizobium sp. CSA112]MDE5452812.1 hypothetical protein [Bradyrhizobium sp. CSA112]
MRAAITKLAFHKGSIRAKLSREIARRFNLFPYETRIANSAIDRPHYGYCVLQAAKLARKLGHKSVSVIEFGVAGGNGLLNLEMHAAEVKKLMGIEVQIFGFDTGQGLPPPDDYRDLPHHWRQGFFAMDGEKLKAKLTRSQLVLGNIADRLPQFVRDYNPAPIGAISLDLDYYSSTRDAFKLFELHREHLLPRAFIYFDDIIGDDVSLFSEYTGPLLAINEFNASHDTQKICKTTYLTKAPYPETWHHQIYIYHDFKSPDYCRFVSDEAQHLPLTTPH